MHLDILKRFSQLKHFQPAIKACSHPFHPERQSTTADLVILEARIPRSGAAMWFSGTELAEGVDAFFPFSLHTNTVPATDSHPHV